MHYGGRGAKLSEKCVPDLSDLVQFYPFELSRECARTLPQMFLRPISPISFQEKWRFESKPLLVIEPSCSARIVPPLVHGFLFTLSAASVQ